MEFLCQRQFEDFSRFVLYLDNGIKSATCEQNIHLREKNEIPHVLHLKNEFINEVVIMFFLGGNRTRGQGSLFS